MVASNLDARSPVRCGARVLLAGLLATLLLLAGGPIAAGATPLGPSAASTTERPPTPDVAGASDATADSITRLYLAVFGRLPDPTGHRYWVSQRVHGADLAEIAAVFIGSDEWSQRYGSVDTGRFVDLLYRNVLDRSPDVDGKRYWQSVLDDGTARTGVLLHFSESDEFVDRTGTNPPAPVYPPLPERSGVGRRIVYQNSAQRVWLVEADGRIHDSYRVSGRRDTPRPGFYSVFSKSPKAWAGHGGITMNHMVRFARGRRLAIGFHSIPTGPGGTPLQSLAQLGTYQSAGCVRQSEDEAWMLYHWADIGTTVVVLD